MYRIFSNLLMAITVLGILSVPVFAQKGHKIKVLIIDGQNNHSNWPQTTKMMKAYLEETGLFAVDIATTPPHGTSMESFNPDFEKYKAVVMNYNGDDWSQSTQQAFEKYMRSGGGMVSVHAADNAFPKWTEYNKMIGLGGWGNRNEKDGPYVYYDSTGKLVRDNSPGVGGSHGTFHAFRIDMRDKNHPITRGVPDSWMHNKDELYDRLRGPAEHMTILASAYSAKEERGTGRDEPIMMVISYDKGRIFHTTLGHANESQQCTGFITFLQRGVEWAATGKVTQKLPADFPGKDEIRIRK
ncbi:MAG: ThuA domain-containing protein [Bacteroidetes bacterium]|nr:ThuA domain-containing protein [Bacteroidota bacterium]